MDWKLKSVEGESDTGRFYITLYRRVSKLTKVPLNGEEGAFDVIYHWRNEKQSRFNMQKHFAIREEGERFFNKKVVELNKKIDL